MLELFFFAAVLAGAAGATALGVASRRRRRARAAAEALPALPAPGAERRIERGELRLGDVVDHLGSHALVEGLAVLDEGAGTALVVARLSDEATRFLVVVPEEDAAPVIAEAREGAGVGAGLPSRLRDDGLELELVRRLSAVAEVAGTLDEVAAGPCEAGLYEGPGGRAGAVVLGGGRTLVLGGRAIAAAGLTLFQGGHDR